MQQSSHRPGEAGLGIAACRVGSCILRKIAGKFFPPLRSTFFPSSVEVPRCPTMGSSLLGKEGFSKSLPLFQMAPDPPTSPLLLAEFELKNLETLSKGQISTQLPLVPNIPVPPEVSAQIVGVLQNGCTSIHEVPAHL